MNQLSELLPQMPLAKSPGVLALSPKHSTALTTDEKKVIEKKYADPQIGRLTDSEIFTRAAEAVQRIHIITGWNIPDDKSYTRILVEELSTKLKEDFTNMNFQEVVYAFRKNGLGIKDWGKNMNLDLICEVLTQYCDERRRISAQEERFTHEPEQRIYTTEEIENMFREDVEAFYQRCLRGVTPPAVLPDYYKDILVKDKLIHPDSDLHAFFSHCINSGQRNIYIKQ